MWYFPNSSGFANVLRTCSVRASYVLRTCSVRASFVQQGMGRVPVCTCSGELLVAWISTSSVDPMSVGIAIDCCSALSPSMEALSQSLECSGTKWEQGFVANGTSKLPGFTSLSATQMRWNARSTKDKLSSRVCAKWVLRPWKYDLFQAFGTVAGN